MNRGELKTMLYDYIHRNHSDTTLNQWIDWTSKRIGRDLRSFANCATEDFVPTGRTSALPTDFMAMELFLKPGTNGGTIKLQAGAGLTRSLGNSGDAHYYNLKSGNMIEIYPYVAGTYEMTYYFIPADMDTDADTNDVATHWPMLYIYGMMIESAATEQDGELFTAAQTIFDTEISRINRSNLQSLEGMQIEAM